MRIFYLRSQLLQKAILKTFWVPGCMVLALYVMFNEDLSVKSRELSHECYNGIPPLNHKNIVGDNISVSWNIVQLKTSKQEKNENPQAIAMRVCRENTKIADKTTSKFKSDRSGTLSRQTSIEISGPWVKKRDTKNMAEEFQDFPYRYFIRSDHACDHRVTIINIIPSAPASNDIRATIRNLWGNKKYMKRTGTATVFLLGTTDSTEEQALIECESQIYHDIIQLNFTDCYENLNIKTLSILHWTKTFCPQAKWILKSDEDVIIDPFAIAALLANDSNHGDFICMMNKHLRVCRPGARCNQKWAISRTEYFDDYYPPYCSGGGYIIRSEMARRIYEASNKSHPFVMEDVYFTGIVPKSLNSTYTRLSGKRIHLNNRRQKFLWWGYTLMYHKFRLDVNELWQKILKYNDYEN